jgi:hypothetical protein
MDASAVLLDLYGRIPPLVREVVAGLDAATLARAPEPGANPIGWLGWHLTRIQDHHVSEVLDDEQFWVRDDWAPRFGLTADPQETGYGHTLEQVQAVRPESAAVIVEYHEVVDARTRALLERVSAEELDRIVDRRWDPPVTLGVRLVSVAEDSLQHLGQAAYIRGLLERA